MTKEEARQILRCRARDCDYLIASTKKKRSWRDSEKAVAIAAYQREKQACAMAIEALAD